MTDDGLDAFRKNLKRRYDRDHIISPSLTLLLVLIPVFFYIILKYVLFGRYYELVYESRILESIALMITLLIYMAIVFSLYSRLASHAKRDMEWREILIGFAESRGADTARLREMHEDITDRDRFPMLIPINLLLGLMVVFSALVIIIDDLDWAIIVLMILFPTVEVFKMAMPANLLYPRRHEKEQIEFTRALKEALEPVGINISEMPGVIRARTRAETIRLLVCTLGLYIFYLLWRMFVDMNRHIRYQHSYERVLLAQLEGRDVELRTDTKGGFVRFRKKPTELIIAELFLMAVCLMYLMRIAGVALDLVNDRTNVTIIKDLGLEQFYQGGMLLAYLLLMLLAIFAMIGIESGRVLSWRKVIRSCILFLIPILSSMFIYNISSYTHMFDYNPYISLAAVYGITLLMVLSIPIRRYYTPVGKQMPDVKEWVRFVFVGKLFPDEDDEDKSLLHRIIYSLK